MKELASEYSPAMAEEAVSSATTVWALACARLNSNTQQDASPPRQTIVKRSDFGSNQNTPNKGLSEDKKEGKGKKRKKEPRFSVIFFVNGELSKGNKLSLRYAPMKMTHL